MNFRIVVMGANAEDRHHRQTELIKLIAAHARAEWPFFESSSCFSLSV
jgi:hypothetical protein